MNADRLAPWYRWIEYATFGRALERHRFAFLDRLSSARRVLLVGEGDGRTLARLLAVARAAQVDVVEISPQMIALARQRAGSSARVRFVQGDAREVSWPAEHYDGLITCFFLDCLEETELRRLVRDLARSLTARGEWLLSEFATPPKGWRRWKARAWITTMYYFFRITTGLRVRRLPPIESALTNAGMIRSVSQTGHGGMIVSEVWKAPELSEKIRTTTEKTN